VVAFVVVVVADLNLFVDYYDYVVVDVVTSAFHLIVDYIVVTIIIMP